MQTESIDCPICGSSSLQPFLTARDIYLFGPGEFDLVRCASCSLVFVNPRPTPEGMAVHYPEHYWAPPPPEDAKPYLDTGMRRALRLLQDEYPGGRVLDVGCGVGRMAALMRQKGLDAFGLDPYEHACRTARETYGIEAICAPLQQSGLPEQSVDAVTLFDVLEHVHDPVGDLREVLRILRPGGAVIVKAPNMAALQAGLFRHLWYCLDVPRHLLHFSPTSLAKALQAAGFADVRCSAVPDAAGALMFEASVLYWLRGMQFERRGVQVAPAEDQTVGEALDGQVYASVPSLGKRAFRWLIRNVAYAPLAVENLIGRSVELFAVGRRP